MCQNFEKTSRVEFTEDEPTQNAETLVFVCGVGRSGTSLVQSMLASHSKIAFLPETGFFRRYVVRKRLEEDFRRGGIPAVRRRIESDIRFENLGIVNEEILAPFVNGSRELTDLAYYRRILTLFGLRHGKEIVGDKDPRLIEFLPLLHRCFPGAHILHVVRDPRDVLVSKQKAAWSKHRPWWQHAFVNRVQFEMGERSGPKYFGSQYHVLLYEELLARPEGALRRICGHLEMDFERSMLDFAASAQQLVRRDELQWKRETTGPLIQNNSGKWQNSLTAFQTAVVERVCDGTMNFGNYEESGTYLRLPLIKRLMVVLIVAVTRCLAGIYQVYRRWAMGRASS